MTKLESVLEESLEQLSTGKSVEECLRSHPDYADQLRPLLSAAGRMDRAVKDMNPTPGFRARGRAQLVAHMQARPRRQVGSAMPGFQRLAFSLGVLLFAFMSVGTAFAQSAQPGDFLYSWKLDSEQVFRVFSPDSVGTDLWIAERRVSELRAAVGNSPATALALDGYGDVLERLGSQTDPAARERIAPVLAQEVDILIEAGVNLPDMEILTSPTDGLPDGSAPELPLPMPAVGPGI